MIAEALFHLKAEEAMLESELRGMSLYRRLEEVRRSLRDLSAVYADTSESQLTHQPRNNADTLPSSSMTSRPDSRSTRIANIAEETMRKTSKRFGSGELTKILVESGIDLKGKKPSAIVASLLSHHPLFNNKFDEHGIGYGLKEWNSGSGSDHAAEAPHQEQKEFEPPVEV